MQINATKLCNFSENISISQEGIYQQIKQQKRVPAVCKVTRFLSNESSWYKDTQPGIQPLTVALLAQLFAHWHEQLYLKKSYCNCN